MYHRWELSYNGHIFGNEISFETECGTWSVVYFDKREDAIDYYNLYSQYKELEMHLTDNEYGVTLYDGEWY